MTRCTVDPTVRVCGWRVRGSHASSAAVSSVLSTWSVAAVTARHVSSACDSGGVDAGAPLTPCSFAAGTGVTPWSRVRNESCSCQARWDTIQPIEFIG